MKKQTSRQWFGLLPLSITLFITSFNCFSHHNFDGTHSDVAHGFVPKYQHNFLTDFSTSLRCIFTLKGIGEQCDFESPYRYSDPFLPFVFLAVKRHP